jgi:transcriptional regulator with XRE-family HTH domain
VIATTQDARREYIADEVARVGRAVRRLRQARGWTMRALAERSGVSLAHLEYVEGTRSGDKGPVAPTVRTLVKLALALEVPTVALLGGE